nr:hypothetical protein CFP56_25970 [Quercus suber]
MRCIKAQHRTRSGLPDGDDRPCRKASRRVGRCERCARISKGCRQEAGEGAFELLEEALEALRYRVEVDPLAVVVGSVRETPRRRGDVGARPAEDGGLVAELRLLREAISELRREICSRLESQWPPAVHSPPTRRLHEAFAAALAALRSPRLHRLCSLDDETIRPRGSKRLGGKQSQDHTACRTLHAGVIPGGDLELDSPVRCHLITKKGARSPDAITVASPTFPYDNVLCDKVLVSTTVDEAIEVCPDALLDHLDSDEQTARRLCPYFCT